MNKQQKKLLIILVLLITIVIIVVNIFSAVARTFFRETSKDKNNNYSDSQLNMVFEEKGKYNASVLNTEYAELTKDEALGIDASIDFVLDCINNKKYSNLYENISESYAEIKFNTLEKFETYMGNNFPYTDYECVSYKLSSYNCYVTIRSLHKSNETLRIKLRNQDFSKVEETEVIFENFNYMEDTYGIAYEGDAHITAKYLIYYADKASIYIKIENKSNKPMKFDFYKTKLTKYIAGEEIEIITGNQAVVEVGAKKTAYVEIYFDNINAAIYSPNYCYLKVKINDKEHTVEIPLVYQEEEEL